MAKTINDLPNQILMEIFCYTDIVDHTRFQKVCQRWQLLIRRIWSRIKKIEFAMYYDTTIAYQDVNERGYDGLHISVVDLSFAKSILEICQNNLIELDINNEAAIDAESTDAFEPLRQCENLKSFAIETYDNTLVHDCLRSLPMGCLEKLNLCNIEYDSEEQLYKTLEKVLKQARTLKSLSLSGVSLGVLRVIEKIHTLENLALGVNNLSIEDEDYKIDTSELVNLKKYNVGGRTIKC